MVDQVFGLNGIQRSGEGWMVICVDGYDRDSEADWIACRDCRSKAMAERIAYKLNQDTSDESMWFVAVQHDHKLSRGMEDLI